jgi:heavy metal sensor kinase
MFLSMSNTTLASRLTLWYSSIFTFTFVLVFVLTYVLISTVLNNNTIDDLQEDIQELSFSYIDTGIQGIWTQVEEEIASDGADQVFYRLLDAQGRTVRSTDMTTWNALADSIDVVYNPAFLELESYRISHEDYEYDIQVGYANLDENLILQLGLSLEENAGFLEIIRNIFLITTPVLLLLASFFGWFLARKALGGLDALTNTAINISRGKFDERVPYSDHGEEINRLAQTFNAMLDKIQALLSGMRDITDNIAHDLRSPLTRIRGEAETTLTSSQPQEDEQYKKVLANTIEESDRLLNMINTMLDITETEAGLMKRNKSAINISELVHEACDLFQPLASDNKIDFQFETQEGLTIEGNASFLQRLIGNLIDNALKYTQPGGKVSVKLQKVRDNIQIEVRDTGVGIKEEEKDKIFARFYRSDSSRSKTGNGLGLRLAQAIAKAHLGEIQVDSHVDQGSSFKVILPLTSE